VYAQDFEDWELLLVDDGSSDRSTEIALTQARNAPDKVFYWDHAGHQNRGMSASRNLGIGHSRGRYIALLDADDVWLPHKLREQAAILDAHPGAGMVYGASQYWSSWMTPDGELPSDSIPDMGITPNTLVQPPSLLTGALNATARTPCPSDLMVRAELARAVGGFEEHFRGIYQLFEDQAFLSKVYLTCPVFVAGTCWDKYRQHPDSCVSVVKKSGRKYTAGLYYLRWLSDYLATHGIDNPEIWQALRRKRRRYRLPRLYRFVEDTRRRMHGIDRLPRRILRRTLPNRVYQWIRAL
jgi:glycosyltransferase involved in cell wall biosynthesis